MASQSTYVSGQASQDGVLDEMDYENASVDNAALNVTTSGPEIDVRISWDLSSVPTD
jgi:hypothetical protein